MTHRYDTLIRGGMVVSGSAVVRCDLGIAGEHIAEVGELGSADAEVIIDAQGDYVLPGIIDAHCHPVYSDDLSSLTRAGASAGVTTVIPYIGAIPAWGFEKKSLVAVTTEFVERWDGNVACDFGVHVAVDSTDDLGTEIEALVESGIPSFKFFMAYRARGMMSGDDELLRHFQTIADHGGLAVVHAENGAGVAYLEGRHWDSPVVPNDLFLGCHTDLLEAEAILRAGALADAAGCSLYIAHLAVGEGIELVQMLRRMSRAPVWVETCPHYLLLTNDEVVRRGSLAKIAPPLRDVHDNEALWEGLSSGEVDVIATDHCGRTQAVKSEGKNLLQQAYGAESIEHFLPLIYTYGVATGRIDVRRMVRALCERPADIFGLSSSKGRLMPGMDADVALLNPNRGTTLTAQSHIGSSDYCLYEGWRTRATVEMTMRRGKLTFSRDHAVDWSGGRYVARRLAARARQG